MTRAHDEAERARCARASGRRNGGDSAHERGRGRRPDRRGDGPSARAADLRRQSGRRAIVSSSSRMEEVLT